MDLLKLDKVNINIRENKKPLIEDISLEIKEKAITTIIGNSGSGKSLLTQAIMRILPNNLEISGRIEFKGIDLLKLKENKMNKIRGKEIGIVLQNVSGSLNPLLKNKNQISIILKEHGYKRREIQNRILELLEKVKLEDANRILKLYPHELSGGIKQRFMTAIAISSSPDLLILDEPTKGLDYKLTKEIVEMILKLNRKEDMSILLISHDLELARNISDYIYFINHGKISAEGIPEKIFQMKSNMNLRELIEAERIIKGEI
ncbi:MAG: ABC transporter ATP-binding protein [Tissierellia bacterium]|nr:ABC transporter ATP-binding protein [Tissierellia bacterium]